MTRLLVSDNETSFPDQGQGGAQSIEDGAAIGILFSRLPPFTTADDLDKKIAERLQGFESVRKDRASAMQIFSNSGQDESEKIRDEAMKFLKDGATVPSESPSVCRWHPSRPANVQSAICSESRRVLSVQLWIRCREGQRKSFEWPAVELTRPVTSVTISSTTPKED